MLKNSETIRLQHEYEVKYYGLLNEQAEKSMRVNLYNHLKLKKNLPFLSFFFSRIDNSLTRKNKPHSKS